MATHLKDVFVSCLLLLILMEEAKPVLAKKEKLKKRVKILEESMENVEERLKELEECQAIAVAGLEDSAILKKDASYLEALGAFLKPVVQSGSHWKRCWQASQDGWEAATFHSLCDDKGPTVTIIRVDHKYIFGGYTSLSWKVTSSPNCEPHYDPAAFVYSLVNYPGWQPVKFDQTDEEDRQSIVNCYSSGPHFGRGSAIYIADNASSNTKSLSSLGHNYSAPSGYRFGSSFARSFLAGSWNFQPDEVEVFYETT